ncbi:MAG: TIGR02652 family protein [Proteobacteria bacterium]|nr:TIGR02652 family protein [Pseudomonadota bacterium]
MKQSTITFKTTSEIKEALEKLAKQGFRSRSAQIEMIVVNYLEKQGIYRSKEDKNKDSK